MTKTTHRFDLFDSLEKVTFLVVLPIYWTNIVLKFNSKTEPSNYTTQQFYEASRGEKCVLQRFKSTRIKLYENKKEQLANVEVLF